jgi:hypothetical protein
MVSYFWELQPNAVDMEWVTICTPYHRYFLFYGSNEAVLFVPGSYQEMMEDYG